MSENAAFKLVGASKRRYSSVSDLEAVGLVDAKNIPTLEDVAQNYALGVSAESVSAMRAADASDPVYRQFVPSVEEMRTLPQEDADPIGDDSHSPVKGVVHRYPDRVLFKVTSVCAVYCRYCFRREMVGQGEKPLTDGEIEVALDYIRSSPKVWEVILTGGDPLVLSVRQLSRIMNALNDIEHVRIIRIHSRVPVSDPARITDALCGLLSESAKTIYIALHLSHVQEITPAMRRCVQNLRRAGCHLVSQSVLLKGVNDDVDALEALMRELVVMGVKPYYLHHPDLARGTSHFRLPLAEGQALVRRLLGRVSGLCQPSYMLDIPGGAGKVPINASYLKDLGGGQYEVLDYQGQSHIYEDALDGL